jgi:hypothetical protein
MTDLSITPSDTAYISGPMTGLPDFNIPTFIAMEHVLRSRYGCEVLNPARQPAGLSWTEHMRRDVELLRRATVIVALPGHDKSRGARIELDLACMAGLPVVEVLV